MKKLILITFLIVGICAAINITVASAKTEPDFMAGTRVYIIREYNGRVACFEESAVKPFLTTDVRVNDLPYADQLLLDDGISVSGAKQLSRALEDYKT